MAFPFIINPIQIEINSFLIKPKLKSTLELNPISLLPLHQSRLSLNPIMNYQYHCKNMGQKFQLVQILSQIRKFGVLPMTPSS